uniref:Uncharacterized protein n=1 Tax=Candidatus Methanogaster sp. ANME-2c ERB4 TaxID=2759911 RepID=A0A7G9Y2P0_9EURY|nr:hypothetical protein HEBJAHIM_00003 [Methanosarcinales archaeon ANME-2c ERB4]QNO42116.1 hypothetical protein INBEEEIC_00018 [Methanosarcinales archaeon ANME-2c ERB4]QNO42274.1 hypothetical protein CCKMDOMK_00003 [Methanosarcinales archaeon ANME-2c ERB4]QNO42482.1 hypothetical protein LBOOMNCC_00035 [Methanosarcinales archaeon ANME-2c ERB4]QNO42567.1 hypothetical protein MMDHCPHC_00003 [Methanosarcinales archaeon ANME-2c ERB4]
MMDACLGCESKYQIFFRCDDCKYADIDEKGCAEYRREFDAKIGFEIRG